MNGPLQNAFVVNAATADSQSAAANNSAVDCQR